MSLSPGNSFVVEQTITNPLADPIFVNDAAVTGIIKDTSGAVIEATFTLDYVASSNGVYRKTLDPIANLVIGNSYIITINAVGTDALEFQCELKVKATNRNCCS